MSHSYRDTQGGHIDPPQVVNCPNHPRLDRVKLIHKATDCHVNYMLPITIFCL